MTRPTGSDIISFLSLCMVHGLVSLFVVAAEPYGHRRLELTSDGVHGAELGRHGPGELVGVLFGRQMDFEFVAAEGEGLVLSGSYFVSGFFDGFAPGAN